MVGNVEHDGSDESADINAYLSSRSSITIVGEGKTGTFLDGERLPADNQTRTLPGTRYILKLGSSETTLVLEWRSVVVALGAGVSKAARANGSALSAERAVFTECDIKIVLDYVPDKTTHTIAKKRNTGPALHALVQGSWLVTLSFVKALAAVCMQDGQDEDGTPHASLLEEDFTKHWPQEDKHIVPASTEPLPREDSWLKPDRGRAKLFRDYTFVFIDAPQHATLTPVINAAGGATVCFECELGETSVKSITDRVQELAGKKDSLQFSLSEEPGPGGIVTVRAKDTVKFGGVHAQLDNALNQRSIEQAELLDIILRLDTSSLRQAPLVQTIDKNAVTGSASGRPSTSSVPAPSEIPAMSRMPASSDIVPPSGSANNGNVPEATQERAEQQAEDTLARPPVTKKRRFITQKFQGFDDFEPSSIVRPASRSPEASHGQSDADRTAIPAQNMDIDVASRAPATSQRIPQKRPVPVEEEEVANKETAEQRHERMFPGQALAKRRKIEEAKKAAASTSRTTPAPEAPKEKDEPQAGKVEAKVKKGKKAVDETRAKMLAKREAQEEEHRRDEEDMQKGFQGELPILGDKDANPTMFAEMELPVRALQPTVTISDNPAWAGRPNYKKFKKRQSTRPVTGQENIQEGSEVDPKSHIIAVEDRSSRPVGLGEEYRREHSGANARNKQNKGQSKSQTTSQGGDAATLSTSSVNLGEGISRTVVDEEERAVFRRRLHSSRQMDEDEAEANAMFDAPPGTNSTFKSTSQSTFGTATQNKAAGKRPATTQLSAPVAKQARTIATSVRSTTINPAATELSDDDDPRTFRRRRR